MNCTNCGHCHHGDLTRTLDPSVYMGRCLECNNGRFFRAEEIVPHDLEAGREAKHAGMARTETKHADYAWRFDQEIIRRTPGQELTSEDITAVVGVPPSSGVVGARMNAAAKRGLIVRSGFRPAKRVNQHAALVSVWVRT